MNGYNFSAFGLPTFTMIGDSLSPAERFSMAIRTNEAVLNRLAGLPSRPQNVFFDVTLEAEQKTITLRFEDNKQDFKIAFAEVMDPEATFTVITEQDKAVAQFLRTLETVQELFSGSVSKMNVDLGVLDKEALDRLRKVQCEKLIVKGATEGIPKEEVAETLSEIKATKEYCIESDSGHKVLSTVLPTEKLVLGFSHGITGADLLKMAGKVKNIDLGESSLTSEDVHGFIETWLESSERTTVTLKMSRKDKKVWDLEQVLRGILHSEFDSDRRDKMFVVGRNEMGLFEDLQIMSDARDIRREDGLYASVRIIKEELFFCVWHDPKEVTRVVLNFFQEYQDVEQQIDRLRDSFYQLKRNHEQIDVNKRRLESLLRQQKRLPKRRQNIPEMIRISAELKEVVLEQTEVQKQMNDNQQEGAIAIADATRLKNILTSLYTLL